MPDIAAFAGFASAKAREACFAKGMLDSIVCLGSTIFRKFHYKTMLGNTFSIKLYIDPLNTEVKNLKLNHEDKFKSILNSLTPAQYVGDLNKNMRPKLVDRIGYIINNIINHIKDNLKGGVGFQELKSIGIYIKYGKMKKVKVKLINIFQMKYLKN